MTVVYFVGLAKRGEELAQAYEFGSFLSACSFGVHDYWLKKKEFPSHLSEELKQVLISTALARHATIPQRDDWLRFAEIRSLNEALEAADAALPGQVVYCAIMEQRAVVGYLMLGKTPQGELYKGTDGKPLIAHEGRGDALVPFRTYFRHSVK